MLSKTISWKQSKALLFFAFAAAFSLIPIQYLFAQAASYTFSVKAGGTVDITWASLGITNGNIDRYAVNTTPAHGTISRSDGISWYEWGSANFGTHASRVFKGQTLRYVHDSTNTSETLSIVFWEGGFSPHSSSFAFNTGGTNTPPVANSDAIPNSDQDCRFVPNPIYDDSSGEIYFYDQWPAKNDSDKEGGQLTVTGVQDKSKTGCGTFMSGALIHYYPGGFTYLKEGQTYKDEIYYNLSDGNGRTATGTIYVTITGKNQAPQATDVPTNGTQDTDQIVTLNATDPESDTLTYSIASLPAKGKLYAINNGIKGIQITAAGAIPGNKVIFTPNAGEYGEPCTTFTFKAKDGKLDSNVCTQTINVKHINHAPQANNSTPNGFEDTDLMIPLSASDLDNDPLTYKITTLPAKGSLYKYSNGIRGDQITTANSDAGGNIVIFVPLLNESGNNYTSFQFTVFDNTAISNTGTVTITITSVNDPPVVTDATVTGNEDTDLTITFTGTDIENNALTYSIVTLPAKGKLFAVSGGVKGDEITAPAAISGNQVIFTPDLNENGTNYTSFQYKANDGQADSNTSTITINVTPVNDASIVTDQVLPGIAGNEIAVSLTGSDIDGDALTYTIVTPPAKGKLFKVANGATGDQITSENTILADNNVIFICDATESGDNYTSFTFKANDGKVDSNIGTVTFNITVSNHAPVAVDDTAATYQDHAITIPVLSNDSDVDGDTLSIQSVSQPTSGQVTNTATDITFTPNSGFKGTDTFNYIITDGKGATAQANVTVTVNPLLAIIINPVPKVTVSTVLILSTSVHGGTGTYTYQWMVSDFPAGATTEITAPAAATTSFSASAGGSYTISFTVNDGVQPAVSETITFSINTPPEFTGIPWAAAEENTPYNSQIPVEDKDGDDLSVTMQGTPGIPSWLRLDRDTEGKFILTGTPPALPEGTNSLEYNIIITANDGYESTTQEFILTVGKSSTAFPPVSVNEWALY